MINATTHNFTEIPLSPNAQPLGITAGPDGNIWFTEFGTNQIGMINPTTLQVTEFPPLPTPNAEPYGITAGPNGTIWFTEWGVNQIGMIDIATKQVSQFVVPTVDSVPEGITLGTDGNIWFTENLGNKIGMINPTSDAFSEFTVPTSGSDPAGITAGPGGNLWFTEYSGNKIGMLNPTSGAFSEFAIPASETEPTAITAAPNGDIWFTQSGTNQIARLNPSTQVVTEFTPPTLGSGPRGITAAPNGNVWFTEIYAGNIGVVQPQMHLVVTAAPPSELNAYTAFGLTVYVENDTGAVDTGYSGSVSVAVASGPGGAALGGNLNVPVVNGVATFSGLSLNESGGYTLQVSSAGTTPSLTGPITVASKPLADLADPSPIITSEQALFAGKGKHKHLVGFQLTFNSTVAAAIARSAPPTTPSLKSSSAVRTKICAGCAAAGPLQRLVAHSEAAARRHARFTNGGQLVVSLSPQNTITGSSVEDAVFTILPDGRGYHRLIAAPRKNSDDRLQLLALRYDRSACWKKRRLSQSKTTAAAMIKPTIGRVEDADHGIGRDVDDHQDRHDST